MWFICPYSSGRINLLIPNDPYISQWTKPSLSQTIACCFFSTEPLPEPMLAYCQLDPGEHILVKFEAKYHNFHTLPCILKCLDDVSVWMCNDNDNERILLPYSRYIDTSNHTHSNQHYWYHLKYSTLDKHTWQTGLEAMAYVPQYLLNKMNVKWG